MESTPTSPFLRAPRGVTAVWQDRTWWSLVVLILLGRLAWWAFWGLLLEADSAGYLDFQVALYHPPGYTVFANVVAGIFQWVDAVLVVQQLAYAVVAALFLRWHFPAGPILWAMAVLLAIEPCSGQLGAAVMTETLFLGCLFLAWLGLSRIWDATIIHPRHFLLVGACLGAAYLLRFAAPVFVVAILLHLLGRGWPWRRWLWTACLLLIGFQGLLLPVRLYYKAQFGTWTLNAFSGASLWNLSAYLYPGSDVQAHPQGDFETRLQAYADSNFIMKTTRYTNHIFQSFRPYPEYVAALGGGAQATAQASAEVGRTARRLLAEQPGRHLREFILPNVLRPLSQPDTIYADGLPDMIGRPMASLHRTRWQYSHFLWGFWMLVLLGATLWQVLDRRMPAMAGLLLWSVWLYYIAVVLLSVVFLRFLFVLAPVILLAHGLQVQAWWASRARQDVHDCRNE